MHTLSLLYLIFWWSLELGVMWTVVLSSLTEFFPSASTCRGDREHRLTQCRTHTHTHTHTLFNLSQHSCMCMYVTPYSQGNFHYIILQWNRSISNFHTTCRPLTQQKMLVRYICSTLISGLTLYTSVCSLASSQDHSQLLNVTLNSWEWAWVQGRM